MKRVITAVTVLIFSVSFCMAQSVQEALQQQKEREAQEQRAIQEQKKREAEAQRLAKEAEEERKREFETLYQNTIESAKNNIGQKRYELAEQDYLTALELKPENAAYINEQLEKIENFVAIEKREQKEAERERLYQEAVASAQRNFEQKKYANAKEDYRVALNLKPENAAFIHAKIAEIDKPATLYLYRKRGNAIINLGTVPYDIRLDNMTVGRSKNKWKTSTTVKDFGTKTVSATIEGRKASVNIDFEPGGEYYVRAGYTSRTVGTGKYSTYKDSKGITQSREITKTEDTPTLEVVSKGVGRSEYDAIENK